MINFGILKSKIENRLTESYGKDTLKKDLTRFKKLVLENKNISKNGIPNFLLIKNPLLSQGFSGMLNIQISGTDLPSIEDIDNDGDLDLICFNFFYL